MERLTKRNEDDTAYYYPNCFKECDGVGYSSKCDTCSLQDKVCEKLGRYEDLEEQGLLPKLPCGYGTTVYVIPTKENCLTEIAEMECLGFFIGKPCSVANLFSKEEKAVYNTAYLEAIKTVKAGGVDG